MVELEPIGMVFKEQYRIGGRTRQWTIQIYHDIDH
jgi:hypothetical protein